MSRFSKSSITGKKKYSFPKYNSGDHRKDAKSYEEMAKHYLKLARGNERFVREEIAAGRPKGNPLIQKYKRSAATYRKRARQAWDARNAKLRLIPSEAKMAIAKQAAEKATRYFEHALDAVGGFSSGRGGMGLPDKRPDYREAARCIHKAIELNEVAADAYEDAGALVIANSIRRDQRILREKELEYEYKARQLEWFRSSRIP